MLPFSCLSTVFVQNFSDFLSGPETFISGTYESTRHYVRTKQCHIPYSLKENFRNSGLHHPNTEIASIWHLQGYHLFSASSFGRPDHGDTLWLRWRRKLRLSVDHTSPGTYPKHTEIGSRRKTLEQFPVCSLFLKNTVQIYWIFCRRKNALTFLFFGVRS